MDLLLILLAGSDACYDGLPLDLSEHPLQLLELDLALGSLLDVLRVQVYRSKDWLTNELE